MSVSVVKLAKLFAKARAKGNGDGAAKAKKKIVKAVATVRSRVLDMRSGILTLRLSNHHQHQHRAPLLSLVGHEPLRRADLLPLLARNGGL